jgi:hypothetical protein
MSGAVTPKILRAVHISPENAAETPLGELEFGESGRLKVLKAEKGYQKFLDDFVKFVNAQDRLGVKSSPDEESGEGRYGLGIKVYDRASEDFYRGVRNYARCYYAMALTSDEDAKKAQQQFEELT